MFITDKYESGKNSITLCIDILNLFLYMQHLRCEPLTVGRLSSISILFHLKSCSDFNLWIETTDYPLFQSIIYICTMFFYINVYFPFSLSHIRDSTVVIGNFINNITLICRIKCVLPLINLESLLLAKVRLKSWFILIE